MPHTKEEIQFHQFDTLSAATTKLLVDGNFSVQTQNRIQRELNAYCILNSKAFAGILYHPDGSGPEKPGLKPDGTDWTPEIQAIAKIGIQHEYWSMLNEAVHKGKIAILDIPLTNILVLHPAGNGKTQVETTSSPQVLKEAAKLRGDSFSRFPKDVTTLNYAGDGDFYGPDKNSIFPMRIWTAEGNRLRIARESLGVSDEMVQRVWQSWIDLDTEVGNSIHHAVLNVYSQFPAQISHVFRRALQERIRFMTASKITTVIILEAKIYDSETIDKCIELIKQSMGGPEANSNILHATETHARNLSILYKTAKENTRDIYRY